jgi:hypothetical protein
MSLTGANLGACAASLIGYYLWRAYRLSRLDLDIRSTHVKRCLRCNAPITAENDSGWQMFVNGTYTQAVCKTCMESLVPKEGDPIPEAQE